MDSLVAAIAWDEERYGREYDLSVYNIVALPGFRFGAMENKGLAIYDSSQVLIDPATATDAELDVAAALVAHEYFHNWSGNRVTCRDWFQMTLKEGFTVFRDQCFSADRGSAGVKRIEDVRALRMAQFTEDAGPRAHPPRPPGYGEVADLYTSTVYTKGAEIVRMIRTVAGDEAFRAGTDLYFARHDGQATSCEDFVAAIEDACKIDLRAFLRWYDAAGTPALDAALEYDAQAGQAKLRLSRDPRQPRLPIPLRVALFDFASGAKLPERLVVLEAAELVEVFADLPGRPVLSINRGFSAPVRITTALSLADLAFLSCHEDDPFARHEAMQELMLAALRDPWADREPLLAAVRAVLRDATLDAGLVAELVSLPPEKLVADRAEPIDPGSIHATWKALRADLGRALETEWREACAAPVDTIEGPGAVCGARRLRGVALGYLLAGGAAGAGAVALRRMQEAETMTEREAALRALADSDAPERVVALETFHRRHRGDPYLLDKWFSVQARSARDDTIEIAPRLLAHPDFTLAHPGRLGAIVGAFAANPHAFHDPSGRGYRFLADVALVLDRSDPAGAARMTRVLEDWRRYEPVRSALMKAELERIACASGASVSLRDCAAASLG
jgi:aminopeptidase N